MHHRAAKDTTLGILGGGQLGMLIALAAKKRGLKVHLYLDKEEHAPATPYAEKVFMGEGFSDATHLTEFVKSSDVVVLENEFVPAHILQSILATHPRRFVPDLRAYEIFQNKALEKLLAFNASLAVVPWKKVTSLKDISDMLQLHGRLVLKTCYGGYDGYGNMVVDARTSESQMKSFLSRGNVLAEAFLDYKCELSVVIARGANACVAFPVAETIQQNQICHYVCSPARLSSEESELLQFQAKSLIEASGGVGLFGVEFFQTHDGRFIYNETAPRPHNSAHFTLTGCNVSQFDSLIELALDESLTVPQLVTPAIGMLNLLGTRHGPPHLEPLEDFTAHKSGELCLYGKPWSRPGRKMGHFNLPGERIDVILSQLEELKLRYQL